VITHVPALSNRSNVADNAVQTAADIGSTVMETVRPVEPSGDVDEATTLALPNTTAEGALGQARVCGPATTVIKLCG
jgi:hypothetical protein